MVTPTEQLKLASEVGQELSSIQSCLLTATRKLNYLKGGIAETTEQPAPPIEVEMRVTNTSTGNRQLWECWIAEMWLTTHNAEGMYTFSSLREATAEGEHWLAALGKQLGVKLAPKWEEKETSKGETNDRP